MINISLNYKLNNMLFLTFLAALLSIRLFCTKSKAELEQYVTKCIGHHSNPESGWETRQDVTLIKRKY